MSWKKKLEILVKLPIGLVLYLLSPSFRATVRRKLRGVDDKIAGYETVVAVVSRKDGSKEVIE